VLQKKKKRRKEKVLAPMGEPVTSCAHYVDRKTDGRALGRLKREGKRV